MIETHATTRLCYQCRFENPAAAKFCSECGERFVPARMFCTVLEPGTTSSRAQSSSAPPVFDPRAAFEQFVSTLAPENATSRLKTTIEAGRAQLKTLGVPLPKATNPILVSLMESLKALPSNEISARIAIVTALGRMGDPAVLPPLLLVTGAQSKDVRKATAIALGCIHHPLSAYLLLPMLQDGSSRVRQASFQALIQLHQPEVIQSILAACLCNKSLRNLIQETLRLVSKTKRNTFFELLAQSSANLQPELKAVADWLQLEFKDAVTQSGFRTTDISASVSPKSERIPAISPPAGLRPEAVPAKAPMRQNGHSSAESETSDFLGQELSGTPSPPPDHTDKELPVRKEPSVAEIFQLCGGREQSPAKTNHQDGKSGGRSGDISKHRFADSYERNADSGEDGDDGDDVRFLNESDSSVADQSFFNALVESLLTTSDDQNHEHNRQKSSSRGSQPSMSLSGQLSAPEIPQQHNAQTAQFDDDDGSELEFASNGSQTLMSLSGMLAAPEISRQSSGEMTRPAARHSNGGIRTPELPGQTKHGSPGPAQPAFAFSANETATAMGNTPGLGMPLIPLMHPGATPANGMSPPAIHPGNKSATPAFDITTSSPLIPAFTSSATEPVAFTATTSAAGQAGCEVTSTDHKSGTASGVTPIVLPGDDEQSIDEIEAAKELARAAHEKALARLSAAREEAFRKLLEDTEEVPKTLPRLLKKRVSALMATPSTKMDQVIEQLHELGATNSPAALSTLASFCHKPAKQVREACAQAIGCIAHPGSAVLLLKLLADKSGTVVEAALKALTKLDLEPTRSVLLAAGLCGTSLKTVVTVGVESTSDDKKSEWETLLLEVLRGDDTNSAAFAVSLLARMAGDTHLEIFQQLATHKAPVLRAAAVEALARTQAKRAISQINDALEDTDPTVRSQAAMSVATMYSPRSVELLQKLVFDGNLNVRRNAAQSMSRIDESDLADVIARALDQETDATTVEYLLAALQRNGAISSLPILQRYIEGESSQFREQAVKALRKLKIPASVPIFRRLLDDHAPALRRQAVEQLAVLKPDSVVPRLREMLKQDPDENVRSACAKALGDFGDESSVHLLEEALEDHPLVRLQAVIALGRLGQASAGPILLSLMRDQLPEVRYQAVRAVAQLKLEGVEEQIVPLLEDADEMVRRGAEQTLADLGVRTGNRKARQWKRRLSIAAGWIAPSTIAGLVPGGAKTLFAVILLLASSVGMFAFKGILMAASGEKFEIEPPVSMSVSSSGENILVVRQFGVSEVWNLKSGTLACRQLLPGRVTGGVFVDDASLLINQDGKMVAYDFLDSTLKEAGPTLNLPEQITHTILHRQTKTLFVAYLKENLAHLASYSLQTMKLQSDRILSKIPGGQMTVSPDGNFVASMSGATVLVYDLKLGQVGEFSFSDLTGGANGGEVLSMCFSDDMQFLAISQSSYGVAVIEMATTSVKTRLEPKDSFGYAFVRFAPGSHNLVAVSTGGKVIVSSSEFASTEDFNIEGCRSAIDMFSVSDDNKQLAVASTEELDVFIGDAVTRKVSHQLVAVDNE